METIEKDVENYRKSHKNCEYCAHAKFHSPCLKYNISCPDYWTCECSDRIIRIMWKAKLCRYYRVLV